MNSIDLLKNAANLGDVAALVGFKPKTLAYLLYKMPEASRYARFNIQKSSGGTREILAPVPQLKLVQRRLAEHLQNCLHGIESKQVVKQDCVIAHGFKRQLSIATNAANHQGRRWVLNLDLKDFFPSINFGRVRGYFIKNKHFLLNADVATIIAQICCYENQLPQGAPTSPVISNLIAGLLDIRLNSIASKNRCTYTRYADDITFSTNLLEFPETISKRSAIGNWELAARFEKRINATGFSVNRSKTRMQFKRSRQDVTGLIVNQGVGIKRERIKQVRAQVDCVVRSQVPYVNVETGGVVKQVPLSLDALNGQLAHIAWVKGREAGYQRIKDGWKKEPGFVRMYRRFLDHEAFVTAVRPVVVCEGKTDSVYLRCSIESVAGMPANLKDAGAASGLGIRLYSFSKTSSWVQRLGGGTGDLKNLISDYAGRVNDLGAKKFTSPVLLVVDNDSGASKGKLNSLVRDKSGSKTKVDGSQDFYHVGYNLYVVYTPKTAAGADTMIEDFLPTSVLSKTLGGKTLELDEKKFDPKKNFGKVPLAESIVRRQKSTIDFSGFLPLLVRMSKAIDHFEKGQFRL